MNELPIDWALPALTPFNTRWFTAAEVAIQSCDSCGVLQHPPEEVCCGCGAMEFGHRVLSPHGTLHSYTVVHHPVNGALAPAVPYVVALVGLDEAPQVRVLANLLDVERDDITMGMAVAADWADRVAENGDVIRLLQWRPTTMARSTES